MYHKIFIANQPNDLTIKLPDEYLNKEVEVIAFEVSRDKDVKQKDVDDAIAFFNTLSVDMHGFTFNRDEANER